MKVVDTKTLKRMLSHARARGFNRQMHSATERMLDPDGKHVLTNAFDHGDGLNIRCGTVLCKMLEQTGPFVMVLDFTYDDFLAIPEFVEQETA